MATIVLTIPDAVLPRVITSIATKFNYAANKLTGETQGQFAKRMLVETLKQWVKDGERIPIAVTQQTSQAASDQDIETNVLIT
jgi:hypothetical protein